MSISGIEQLGFLAAVLTTLSGLPQFIKILREKSAKEVSLLMYVILASGNFCWLIYGFLINSSPLILANVITGIISLSIIFSKLKYSDKK